jgi:hypothetical protein
MVKVFRHCASVEAVVPSLVDPLRDAVEVFHNVADVEIANPRNQTPQGQAQIA